MGVGKYEETALRILLSSWMSLSKDIVFSFKDKTLVDVERVEDIYPAANDKLTMYTAAEGRARRFDTAGDGKSQSYTLVASVWNTAQWRVGHHHKGDSVNLQLTFT